MLTLKSPAEQALADAALAWLRNAWRTPVQVPEATSTEHAATALWAVALSEVCPPPAWRALGEVEHVAHPITLLAGALLGHPGLHILAAAMERADGYSLALAAARACPADPARHTIAPITPLAMAAQLAAALQAEILDADTDHASCMPVHESAHAVAVLNREEPHRPRRPTTY